MASLVGISPREAMLMPPATIYDLYEIYVRQHTVREAD